MLIAPGAARILCFGDSNTHGSPSDDPDYVRLPIDRRWTGLLQQRLADGYDVVEEGLGGRTTDVDEEARPGCNGRTYFGPCLRTHEPLDVVVVMLGSNDLKACFHRSPEEFAGALAGYFDDVAASTTDASGVVPRTILLSPVWLDDTQPAYVEMTGGAFDATAPARSRALGPLVRRVAAERGALFGDAAQVARPGPDGLHLSPGSHAPLADLVASLVRRALVE
jgi:lysophospholipase L1-like esterase